MAAALSLDQRPHSRSSVISTRKATIGHPSEEEAEHDRSSAFLNLFFLLFCSYIIHKHPPPNRTFCCTTLQVAGRKLLMTRGGLFFFFV